MPRDPVVEVAGERLEAAILEIRPIFLRHRCPECGEPMHYRSRLCKRCSDKHNLFDWRKKR